MDPRRVTLLIKRLYTCICLLAILAGCNSGLENDGSTTTVLDSGLSVQLPRAVSTRIDADLVNLVVTRNGQPVTTTREGSTWTAALVVEPNQSFELNIRFVDNNGVLLATLTRSIGPVTQNITVSLGDTDFSYPNDDGDSATNIEEIEAGTDPNDPTDFPINDGSVRVSLELAQVKTFVLRWRDVDTADSYRVLENPDGASGFSQVGENILPGVQRFEHYVPLFERTNAQYIVEACSGSVCVASNTVSVAGGLESAVGYLKASNTDPEDTFGREIAMSADGNTLAVSALHESSASAGINGPQADNSLTSAGAVYVFQRADNLWQQQAYIKPASPDRADRFGNSISISADGQTLAVGVPRDDSAAIGINGDATDNSKDNAGAVYVFVRSGQFWTQQAYIKPNITDEDDDFGASHALSGDGNTLLVSARGDDSASSGVGGNNADNSLEDSGAVYVFTRSGSTWTQQSFIKASNPDAGDIFGWGTQLSSDGNIAVISSFEEDSAATGVNGDQSDNTALQSGAVYVFSRNGTSWIQDAYLKASNTETEDFFGRTMQLSNDGLTLAVGAHVEDSGATGVSGNQSDNSTSGSGAVYVFTRNGSAWSQQAYLKAINTGPDDLFGDDLSINGDGSRLAVVSRREDSASSGINGDPFNNNATDSGAVFVFDRNTGGAWAQTAYVKSSNNEATDFFGVSVALSEDGKTLAVGAFEEDGGGTGIGADQSDNTASNAGAVYLY